MLSVGKSVDYTLVGQALLLVYSSSITDVVSTVLMYLEITFAHSYRY